MTESEQRVAVERTGKTEADWSSASGSSADLPKFVEGEYQRMLELREEVSEAGEEGQISDGVTPADGFSADTQAFDDVLEGGGSADREAAVIRQLEVHMSAILAQGGENRDPEAVAAASRGLARRIARPLARTVRRQGQPEA